MSSERKDVATWLLVACAMIVVGLMLRREFFSPKPTIGIQPKAVVELDSMVWKSLVGLGHSRGPQNAGVVIVEFADFECPACRSFSKVINSIQAQYPNDIRLEFRHWPLGYHKFAYPAARAAECAGAQGNFFDFHEQVYGKQDSLGLKSFASFARDAGVKDSVAFAVCNSASDSNLVITRDMDAIKALSAGGTPTLIVNGKMFSWVPDSIRMDSIVKANLKGSSVASQKE